MVVQYFGPYFCNTQFKYYTNGTLLWNGVSRLAKYDMNLDILCEFSAIPLCAVIQQETEKVQRATGVEWCTRLLMQCFWLNWTSSRVCNEMEQTFDHWRKTSTVCSSWRQLFWTLDLIVFWLRYLCWQQRH